MFIVRSLLGKVGWQDPNAAEVVKISSGQFFLTRKEILRSNRECIYNEAMITIRRTNMDHNFQLVVTRVYEDEDQELLEDEDETDEERVFLIGEELEFRAGETDGDPTFIWRDLDGAVDEMFEFVANGTNEHTRGFFETCMYRAMYERKYRRSADNVTDAQLSEFVYKEPRVTRTTRQRAVNSNTAAAVTKQSPPPPPVAQVQQAPPSPPSPVSPPSPTPEPEIIPLGPPRDMPTLNNIVTVEAEIYSYDFEAGNFTNQGIVWARLCQRKDDPFSFYIVAATQDGPLLSHQIRPETNPQWSQRVPSLTWNNIGEDGSGSSWLFRFANNDDYTLYRDEFIRAQWSSLHKQPWAKAKADEQSYALSSVNDEDVEMRDINDDSDDEDEIEAALDAEEDFSGDEEEEEDDYLSEEEDAVPELKKGERNSQLATGYRGDRSFVLRGNTVGVFKHDSAGSVKYVGTISKLATPKGKELRPDHVMLHDQDSTMVLMNKENPNSLFSLDVESGKIVEEWRVHDDIAVNNIAPENKFAPTTREQTLVGTSHNALFRIDPRVSGTKLVDSQYKQYTSKNKFSGVVTTKDGKLAVASEKGDIRLFDSIGKNAKTALPPLGDPILGIDVTANGRWIVATTKTYLLVVDTLIGEGKYSGQLGFDRSFPATSKPKPLRLQLKPEHVAYMGNAISFTAARFNQGPDQEENAIITSTGQYVVAWDFKKVMKRITDKYDIKKYEDHVVQDNFRFGDDKEIVVALDNNVLAINKKKLMRPTRQSLAPDMGYSHSSIVNAPY